MAQLLAYHRIQSTDFMGGQIPCLSPDRSMVSLVLQQGDCNVPVMYQSLMNHMFSTYIGLFMDVYLDDIMIYSDTLQDHIKHVKLIIDKLKEQSFKLNAKNMQLLMVELKVLSRVVNNQEICMDPDKVDSVLNWKVPTNRDLLCGFLASVGYLTEHFARARIMTGILHDLTSDSVPFCWTHTYQCTFLDVKHSLMKAVSTDKSH
jgi:hypothetical protein